MAIRNCPNCNSRLHKFDNFFCTVCGNQLPPELTRIPDSIKERNYTSPASLGVQQSKAGFLTGMLNGVALPSPEYDKRSILMLAVFGVTVGVALGLYFLVNSFSGPLQDLAASYISARTSNRLVPVQLTEEGQRIYSNKEFEITANSPLSVGEIGVIDFPSVIPGEADMYIEVGDLDGVMELYVPEGVFGDRVLSLADYVANSFSAFTLEINGNEYWAVLFKLEDGQEENLELDDLVGEINSDEESGWRFKIIGEFLAMSKNSEVFDRIEGVRNKTELSLSLNPEYSENINKGVQYGKARVVFLSFAGKANLEELKYKGAGGDFNSSVDTILETRYKSLIVKE